MTALIPSQPDILEVISDLSNDEVFTPPKVANAVLDLLPPDVWTDLSLRWLDPGCKTGVFLREVTKRLLVGLQVGIPDERERLEHILKNMVHGIAITDLTSLMARRTLYCSKDTSGPHSTVQMPSSSGNVWMERVEHSYESGKCSECGASETQMERENRENYAYALIHESGREAVGKATLMKFDVIVGNPPYQMDSVGGTRTVPLYNLFVEQAKALNPRYISMIIPSRWMAGGLGLNEFRNAMLKDDRIRRLVDYSRMDDLFPGVDFEGGVSYFLWDRDNPGPCEVTYVQGEERVGPVPRDLGEYDIFVRDARALGILKKVLALGEPPITEILAVDKEFGMTSNFTGFRTKRKQGDVALHYNRQGKRLVGWMAREDLAKSSSLIGTWKVMIPEAYGERGAIPAQVLGPTFIAEPPSACTQTYLFVYVDSESVAESVTSYTRTRFFRFLVSVRKITQHATRSTYSWVPQQDWSKEWTDADLFKKYKVTAEEQKYIAEIVKEMPV